MKMMLWLGGIKIILQGNHSWPATWPDIQSPAFRVKKVEDFHWCRLILQAAISSILTLKQGCLVVTMWNISCISHISILFYFYFLHFIFIAEINTLLEIYVDTYIYPQQSTMFTEVSLNTVRRILELIWWFHRSSCLFVPHLPPSRGSVGQQQSGLSPIGIPWLPAGNSWSSLLQPVDLGPAGSPAKEEGLVGSDKQATFTNRFY